MLEPEEVTQVRTLIESVRVPAPSLGIVDAQEFLLIEQLERLGFVMGPEIAFPLLVVARDGRASGEVLLGCGLEPIERIVLLARTLARYWPGRATRSLRASDMFAFHVAVPYSVRVEGASAQQARIDEISRRDDLFPSSELSELLAAANALNRMVDPRDPPANANALSGRARELYEAGMRARRRKHFPAAASALMEARRLGARAGDHEIVGRAVLTLSTMARLRGAYPEACRLMARAIRLARKHELRDLLAEALHDKMVIATEMGREDEALAIAQEALAVYRRGHPRLHVFAGDRAYIWMSKGYFEMALPILLATLSFVTQPGELLSAWGNVARAAGGSGDAEMYDRAEWAVERLLSEVDASAAAADALLEISRGAASLGRWDRAECAAREAYAYACRFGEMRLKLAAETILESAQNDRMALRTSRAQPPRPHVDFAAEILERLHVERPQVVAA
jgi:tetratricopeptide (TPR) repeat protein